MKGIKGIIIDAEKLCADIKESPFSNAQVCRYLHKNSTYLNDIRRRNRASVENLEEICALIGKKPELYIENEETKTEPHKEKEPVQIQIPVQGAKSEPEHPGTSMRVLTPEEHRARMTARTDPSQDWEYNIYRAVENGNDVLREIRGELIDNTDAIRGLGKALKEQTEIIKVLIDYLKS